MKVRVEKTRYVDEKGCQIDTGLSLNAVHDVLSIESGWYRLDGTVGFPSRFPRDMFTWVDPQVPPGWIFKPLEDDGFALGPPEFLEGGFWEDVYDHVPGALKTYYRIRKQCIVPHVIPENAFKLPPEDPPEPQAPAFVHGMKYFDEEMFRTLPVHELSDYSIEINKDGCHGVSCDVILKLMADLDSFEVERAFFVLEWANRLGLEHVSEGLIKLMGRQDGCALWIASLFGHAHDCTPEYYERMEALLAQAKVNAAARDTEGSELPTSGTPTLKVVSNLRTYLQIARNPTDPPFFRVEPEFWDEVVSYHEDVVHDVLMHAELDDRIAMKLYRMDISGTNRAVLVSRGILGPEDLNTVSYDRQPAVRVEVVKSAAISLDTLRRLSRDPDAQVRRIAIERLSKIV